MLAQVLGLTDLGHPYATELAESWLAYGRRCSDSPDKFSKAETVLLGREVGSDTLSKAYSHGDAQGDDDERGDCFFDGHVKSVASEPPGAAPKSRSACSS